MTIEPTTLSGSHVRLEPLSVSHAAALRAVVDDGALWQLPVTFVPRAAEIDAFISDATSALAAGRELPFATIERASNQLVGSTRFMNINRDHKRVEIGFTFIAQSWQRSAVNTEAKLLMLRHAFEHWEFNRVELITDFLNERSRRAISRLGATEEGVLRSHMIMRNGRIRDSVLYGITRDAWPSVQTNLLRRLARGAPTLP